MESGMRKRRLGRTGLDVSILGLGGCSISVLLGLRLLRAIGKSGHLDSKD